MKGVRTKDHFGGKPGPGCDECGHKGYVQKMHCKVSCFECGDGTVIAGSETGQIKINVTLPEEK